eukprot:1089579_1
MGNRKQRDKTNTKSKSLPNKTNHCHIKQYSSSEDLADQYEYTCRDGRWWMERISLSYGISHHSPVNEEQQNANDNDIIDRHLNKISCASHQHSCKHVQYGS